jgi:uncharacterized membrane protein YccC
MPKPDRTAWLFSLNCFVAALLALAIGFWLDLPRPYWAVMTVYITSQPLSGAVRSKAIFRVIGTLLGAAFAVFTVPVLVDSPLLLSFVLALWVAICLFVSLLDRTPRAYVVMLAGYTATLVAFPTVGHPELIFDVAVSRVEEIVLGIICATVTHSLFFPRPVGTVLRQRLKAWLAEADCWALDLLRQGKAARVPSDRRHLATAATEVHIMSTLLPFDTSALADAVGVVRAVHERLMLLVPVLSGIGDRLAALGDAALPLQPELAAMAEWIEAGAPIEAAGGLAQRLASAKVAQIGAEWTALLRESLAMRLQELLLLLGDAHELLLHLDQPARELPAGLRLAVDRQAALPLHRDLGLALMSSLSAMLSIMVVCVIWIVSGWPEGGYAAALAGVFCALFAALDDPAPAIVGFGVFSFVALVVGALYQFAVLPAIDGFPMLALALAPAFLPVGALMVDRRTALPALAFLLGLSSAMALQETFSADFAFYANSNSATYVALWVALLVTRLIRSLNNDAAVRRLMRHIWTALAALAARERGVDLVDLASRMVDRLGLVTPKLAESHAGDGVDALRAVRIAMNLGMLQGRKGDFSPQQSVQLSAMLGAVGRYFSERAAGRRDQPGQELLQAVDHSLSDVAGIEDPERRGGVLALVGLRRNLFPAAPPFIMKGTQ